MVPGVYRKLLVAACSLIAFAAVAQQPASIQSFINPGIQSEIIDIKVHEGSKRFATLEVNGNMHVYDLQGRKLLVSSATNEGETGEGSHSIAGAANLLKFSNDGSRVAYFTVDAGFRLYDINKGAITIEARWPDFKKSITQLGIERNFYPEPDDIHFIGDKYLLYLYRAAPPLNNAFLFNIETNKQVGLSKGNGFSMDELLWSKDSVPGFYINEEKDFQRIHINTGIEKWQGSKMPNNAIISFKDNNLVVSKDWQPVFKRKDETKRTKAFSKDGKYYGYFTSSSGFRLMNTSNGALLITLDWKNKFVDEEEDGGESFDPDPDEVIFLNDRYLLVLYDQGSVNNNAFLFDLSGMKQVMLDGKYGFNLEEVLWSQDSLAALDPLPMRKAQPVQMNVKGEKFSIAKDDIDKWVVISSQGLSLTDDNEAFSDSFPYPETKSKGEKDPAVIQDENYIRDLVYQHPAWQSISKYYRDTLVVEWYGNDTIANNIIAYYQFTNTTRNVLYHKGIRITEKLSGKETGFYITTDIDYIGDSYLFELASPVEIGSKKGQGLLFLHPDNDSLKILYSLSGANDFSMGTFISSPDKNYIVFPQKVNKNYKRWVQLNVLSVKTGVLKTILEIPAEGVREYTEWIRDDYKQLSRYAFLGNEYFIIQGNADDFPVNTQLFETTNWSKLLEIPKKVVNQESFTMPLKSLFIAGDSLLLNNTTAWMYRDNLFADIVLPTDADEDYTLIETEDHIPTNFLKQVPLVSDQLSEKLFFRDSVYFDEEGNPKMLYGKEYLEPLEDLNQRRYFKHVKGNLSLEYYPHKMWGDFENSNEYSDTALGQHVRFTAANGKTLILRSPFGPSTAIIKATISADDKYVFTGSNYNYVDIWSAADGSYLGTVIPNDKNGFLIINKDQYYYSTSADNTRYLYVKLNGKVYPAEEVDAFLNRPDKVMESMSFIDNPQLLAFYKQFALQQQQLSGADSMIHNGQRPLIDLSLEQIPLSTTENKVLFGYSVQSVSAPAKAYLWANNIRVDSTESVSAGSLNNWQVLLQEGSNKIQVEVVNAEGFHSFKETFYINYVPSEPARFRMIGKVMAVSEYEKQSYNLKYAVKDAHDIALGLTEMAEAKTDSLFNEKVSKDRFAAWKQNLVKTEVDDMVIFYLAGHGALDQNGTFYFATPGTDLSAPEKNGISINELQNLFTGIPARKRLLILDACHSGNAATLAMVKRFGSVQRSASESEGLTARGAVDDEVAASSSISERNYSEMVSRQLSTDNSGQGVQIIAATSGGGVAFESDQWENGAFTHYFIDGMNYYHADQNGDGMMLMSELVNYVVEKVKAVTNGKQVPEARQVSWERDWILFKKS